MCCCSFMLNCPKANKKMGKRHQLFLIVGGGGHTAQMFLLQNDFSDQEYEKFFIISPEDTLSRSKIESLGYGSRILSVERFKQTEETLLNASIRHFLGLGIFRLLYQSYKIVQKMDRALVISAGPNLGIFVFIMARMSNNFCVFIESWSRRKAPSRSLKLLKHFSNLVLVQWEEMLAHDPKFQYAGRLR